IGYRSLPVSDLPNVDYPTIQVTAELPGGSPETMASSVATPLERQFSTIAGLNTVSSTSTLGNTQVTLQFDLARNIDAAAQDVQTAISAAARQLPTGMPSQPTLKKVNPADQPIVYLMVSSPTLPLSKVHEYADTTLAQRLSTISGGAQVLVTGEQRYAVRVQVDPSALSSRGTGIADVSPAWHRGNANIPVGTLQCTSTCSTIDLNQFANPSTTCSSRSCSRSGWSCSSSFCSCATCARLSFRRSRCRPRSSSLSRSCICWDSVSTIFR